MSGRPEKRYSASCGPPRSNVGMLMVKPGTTNGVRREMSANVPSPSWAVTCGITSAPQTRRRQTRRAAAAASRRARCLLIAKHLFRRTILDRLSIYCGHRSAYPASPESKHSMPRRRRHVNDLGGGKCFVVQVEEDGEVAAFKERARLVALPRRPSALPAKSLHRACFSLSLESCHTLDTNSFVHNMNT